MQQISATEKQAEAGDLVVSEEVMQVVNHLISCIELGDGGGRVQGIFEDDLHDTEESKGGLARLQFDATGTDSEAPAPECSHPDPKARCQLETPSEATITFEEPICDGEKPAPLSSFHATSSWRGEQIKKLIVGVMQCFVERYRRCIVVLEDLHHLDVASWTLLAALGAIYHQGKWLECGSFPNLQSKQGGCQSVMKCYKAVGERGSTARINLTPLNLWETRKLMELVAGGRTIPHRVVAAVLEKSRGVPIYIEQLTQYLMETGRITGGGGLVNVNLNSEATSAGLIRNTRSVHQLVMNQINTLSSTGHLTLKLAAVIGTNITAEVIREAYPYNTHQYDVELDMVELEGAGFITRCEESRNSHQTQRWRFNSRVAGDAVYRLIPNEQRRHMHAKFAQVLDEGGDRDDAIVAFHWEKSSEGVEAMKWRWTSKAICGWQRAGQTSRDHGDLSEALDCFRRAWDLQEKVIELCAKNRKHVHSKISKLVAVWAKASLPDGISLDADKSSDHDAGLPHIAVVDRVRIERCMAELEKELAESEDDSERKTSSWQAACEHLVTALDLLGVPCSDELAARKKSKKGVWGKLKGGLRAGKNILRTMKQRIWKSSRESNSMPKTPRRRRKSMVPCFMGKTSKLQRRMTQEEMLEAAKVLDLYVAIGIEMHCRHALLQCTDLLDFFVKDQVLHPFFVQVADRLNTEGKGVLLPGVASEHSKKHDKASKT
ncbi:hypothetical protein BSKO_10242 [Bryopsis sp. KO-2023]|nr:hypothetical protein BSKO_10242 [Bryopsis sp. KO-2023]